MSKLSISQQGIQIETHEKTNVMSPYHTMAFIVIGASIVLLLLGTETWIKYLGGGIFILYIVTWLVIYCTHSIKKPELLQSETYRLERQKIETGMIEDKTRIPTSSQEIINSNISVLIEDKAGDINV